MKSASWPPPRPNATANPGPAILDPRDTALPLARVTGWFPRVNCYTFRLGPYRASQRPRHRCGLGLAMSRTYSACIEPCGTAHECKDCGTPLCEKVWMPLEGNVLLRNSIVVSHTTGRRWRSTRSGSKCCRKKARPRARPPQRSRSGHEGSLRIEDYAHGSDAALDSCVQGAARAQGGRRQRRRVGGGSQRAHAEGG
jgi:hypothetical protein